LGRGHHSVKIVGPSAEDTDVLRFPTSRAWPFVLVAYLLGLGGCVDLGRPDFTCAGSCDGGGEDTAGSAATDLGAVAVDAAGLTGPDGGADTGSDAGVSDTGVSDTGVSDTGVVVVPDAAGAAGPEAGADLVVTSPPADAFEPTPDLAMPPPDTASATPDTATIADSALPVDAAPPPDAAVPADSRPPDSPPPPDLPTACTSTLRGRWRLDDGSGSVARDDSCYGNNATVVNGQAGDWQAGRLAGALAITPSRLVYLRVPNSSSLNPAGALSLAIWINPTSWNAGRRHLFQKGALDNQFRVWSESNALWFNVAGLTPASIYMNLPSSGAWHHVAAVYDGSSLRFYLDGTQVAMAAVTGTSQVTTDDLFIGTESASSGSGDFFNGLIDDVLVYGRALTPAEISQVAAAGPPPQ
jgi:hypothetical protein